MGFEGTPGVVMGAGSYRLEAGALGWSGELDFGISNLTEQEISLLNCNGLFGVRLERWSGNEWEHAWIPILPRCLSPPIELAPGEARDFEIWVFGGYPDGTTYPRFDVEPIDGIYRLVVTAGYWEYEHGGSPWGQSVPTEHLTSAPFHLRTEGR